MQTIRELNCTQSIWGFQAGRAKILRRAEFKQLLAGKNHIRLDDDDFKQKCTVIPLTRLHFQCPKCKNADCQHYALHDRHVQGLPNGKLLTFFKLTVHTCRCPRCGHRFYESFPFLSSPKSRITKGLEDLIIRFRSSMSMTDISRHFGISWRTVKDVEKTCLQRKYRHVPLKGVKGISIDEMHIFHTGKPYQKFITIVRSLDDGRVLNVSRGKGVAALRMFTSRIKRFKPKIEYVCMDMSNSYGAWAKEVVPNAEIVYDKFHVIKAMNDRLDKIRRRVMAKLDADGKKYLKGKKYLLLKNEEDLDAHGKEDLDALRESNRELADAHALKESLRRAYNTAGDGFDGYCLMRSWCSTAEASGIPELVSTACTIRKHMKGILGHWKRGRATNASMEGFNGKVRWLLKQSYGFRDFKYFRLKIFDLPSTDINKRL